MALFAVLRASLVPAAAAAAPSFSYTSGRAGSSVRVTSSSTRRVSSMAARSLYIRCEQSAKKQGGGPDVWLGRAAMVGFASAIAVEVGTGKGFLQNFGVATPAPTLALVLSGLVVGLAVFFLLQSGGSRD